MKFDHPQAQPSPYLAYTSKSTFEKVNITQTHACNSVADNNTAQLSASHTTSAPAATEVDIQARLNIPEAQSDTSSPLSSPPSSPSLPASVADSDEFMASPSESEDYFSESEDHVSKTSSQNGDVDEGGSSIEPHRIPLSELRVHHILDEMNLTWSQSQQLHDVMQAEMKSAGLLGEMNFGAQHRQGNSDTLRPIFATVKARLAFLEAANVTRTRLGELLLARAWILNKHEKHNRDMRAKAAKRRAAGKVKAVGEDGEGKEMEPVDAMQQDEVEDVEQPLDAEFPTPRRSSRGVRPSAIAADLGEMDIGTGMIATQREEGQRQVTPGSPMNVDEPVADRIESPARIGSLIRSTTTSIIYPTVFMVRVVNQRTGFAVRSSQLLTEPQRNGYVSIESLSYEMFTTLVSQRLGFNVQGRISGVVPKVHNIALIDSTILITEEVDWQAVLQVWQNHRRSTGEFVVEAEGAHA